MKKVLVVVAVLALTVISSMALAADVTVGGSVQIRSREFKNMTFNKDDNSKNTTDTQERIMIDVNAKAGDVKGKISLWNDFNDWASTAAPVPSGGFENVQGKGFGNSTADGQTFGFREAWILFPLADTGFMIKGGHQLLQLGNGLFFRSQHFGSDAWVAFRDDGPNHLGFVDVKIAENEAAGFANRSTDTDAYVIVDTYKIDDNNKIGVDLTMAFDRGNNLGFAGTTGTSTEAQNLGINYTGKVGPVALKAQVDLQAGKSKGGSVGTADTTQDAKLKGNEIYVRGDMKASDAVAVNFTLGRGSGPKAGQQDYNQYVNFLDVDPHFTFLNEYKLAGPCGKAHQGLCNTTAINVGAKFDVSKNLAISGDLWILTSTEKVANLKDGTGTTNDLGNELDAKIMWKLADGLTWNWDLGYATPGKGSAAHTDAATGIQGVLAFTF